MSASLVSGLKRFKESPTLSPEEMAKYIILLHQLHPEAFAPNEASSPEEKPATSEGKSRRGRKPQKAATPEGEAASEQPEAVES